MAASQPKGVPTPTCSGLKNVDSFDCANELAHFETHLLNVDPITMGRMPAPFFSRAMSRPPKKIEANLALHEPHNKTLMKEVTADNNSEPPSRQLIRFKIGRAHV